jgi:hypothetical protein
MDGWMDYPVSWRRAEERQKRRQKEEGNRVGKIARALVLLYPSGKRYWSTALRCLLAR